MLYQLSYRTIIIFIISKIRLVSKFTAKIQLIFHITKYFCSFFIFLQGCQDSNPEPLLLESTILPIELHPYVIKKPWKMFVFILQGFWGLPYIFEYSSVFLKKPLSMNTRTYLASQNGSHQNQTPYVQDTSSSFFQFLNCFYNKYTLIFKNINKYDFFLFFLSRKRESNPRLYLNTPTFSTADHMGSRCLRCADHLHHFGNLLRGVGSNHRPSGWTIDGFRTHLHLISSPIIIRNFKQ